MLPALPGEILEHHSSKVMIWALRNSPLLLQLETSARMMNCPSLRSLHSLGPERCLLRLTQSLYNGEDGEVRTQVILERTPGSPLHRALPVILLVRIFIAGRTALPPPHTPPLSAQ